MAEQFANILESSKLDEAKALELTREALADADDGELFVEHKTTEGLVWDNGRLKTTSFNTVEGFGLRAVSGETAGYAHSNELSAAALARAADTVKSVKSGFSGTFSDSPHRTNRHFYDDNDPLTTPALADKVKLLSEIDAYAHKVDPQVRQVTVSLRGSLQSIAILRPDGFRINDVRPLVHFSVSVVVGDGDKNESGSFGCGGREGFDKFVTRDSWQCAVDEAIRQAKVNLNAVPAPAGEFDVVLGSGWPGILLHEAVGHGLEGDYNYKKTSAFSDLMGKRVAAKGVTVVDDGTLDKRRGSLTVDDEGTPTTNTVLIEDGILTGFMHDRQSARMLDMEATGNGRRESFAHIPMPRMTNTIMQSGDCDPEEILSSIENGIFAVSFGGGQVDITSGKFVFSCTEAYRIEGGKVGQPIKGAMLIGNGPDALKRVSMIGNDMKLDSGVGTCGKNGQGVPVGVGQPTIRINAITVGGTAV